MSPRQVIPLSPERKYKLYNLKPWLVPPQASVTSWVDMSSADTFRHHFKSHVRLTYTHLFIKAAALALEAQPEVNAVWTARGILLLGDIRIGVIIYIDNRAPAVVIENPQSKPLPQIAQELAELVDASRSKPVQFSPLGRLPQSIASWATYFLKNYPPPFFKRLFVFTISNFGRWGIDRTIPVMTRSPMLTPGRVADRVVAIDGLPGIRPTVSLTFAYDCRVIDDVQASRFMGQLKALLENPQRLA